jgi:signal transduction histidine kinase
VEIKDNGIGFNTADIKQENAGVGLNNIFSRAKLINATVHIDSIINQGTTITILLNSK